MKPTSEREKLLMILAPAFLVLAGYGWKISAVRGNRNAAEAALTTAQSNQPAEHQVLAAQQSVSKIGRDVSEVERAVQEWQGRWNELKRERSQDSSLRNRAVWVLTALLLKNQLRVIDCSPDKEDDVQNLPEALQQVIKQLSQNQRGAANPPSGKISLWKIHFAGRYADLVRALGDLAEQEPFAIPVRLEMEEAKPDTDIRIWNLVVWI